MKKLVIFILFLGIIVSTGINGFAGELGGGFRDLDWGATMEQVLEREETDENTELIEERENKLLFSGEVFGHEVKIIYEFASGYGLYQGTYALMEKNLNQTSLYLDRYREIEEALVSIYGEYHDKQMQWRVELYKDDPEEWGRAVAMRHLNMGQAWFFEDLLIGHLLLEADRFLEVNHRILFVDPGFEDADGEMDL